MKRTSTLTRQAAGEIVLFFTPCPRDAAANWRSEAREALHSLSFSRRKRGVLAARPFAGHAPTAFRRPEQKTIRTQRENGSVPASSRRRDKALAPRRGYPLRLLGVPCDGASVASPPFVGTVMSPRATCDEINILALSSDGCTACMISAV